MSNTENRELTAAELDLVGGGALFDAFLKIEGFMAPQNGGIAPRGVRMEDILVTSV